MGYLKGFLFGVVGCLIATVIWAGEINSPAGPTDAGSAMYTITDVYNRINDGTAGMTRTTTYGEPTAAPGSTGHTLTDLYDLASERSRPAKTGQTSSYANYDDGYYEKGVSWPSTRFTDNGNETVTDNLTGLIWLKNADCFGERNWATALTDCHGLNSTECDLTDSSSEGDWRLPNRYELESLLDMSQSNPALPSGYPFSSVQSDIYWSSTMCASDTQYAWNVDLDCGFVSDNKKTETNYVWPVRAGQ